MAALHKALKSLAPIDYSDVPVNDLQGFLSSAFTFGQLIIDSIPIAPITAPTNLPDEPSRLNIEATCAAEVTPSSARPVPPSPDAEALQKEWKPVKINVNDNPLKINVYKCNGKDGKGAWFARSSVHEGLGFEKWKKALEQEFPETMKVRGAPGEGNIRGIGGERKVETQGVEGTGKMEVYLLSAQFPGPTTPRDFVTIFLSSDQALKDQTVGVPAAPRQFMVISKPCIHPDTPSREGFIRGQYESVEFIREVIPQKRPQRASSAVNLTNVDPLTCSPTLNGKETISKGGQLSASPITAGDSFEKSEGCSVSEGDLSRSTSRQRGNKLAVMGRRNDQSDATKKFDTLEDGQEPPYPVEWVMITRSDPGGSVPRFMVERGTPGGIVADARLFLDWACSEKARQTNGGTEGLQDEKGKTRAASETKQNEDIFRSSDSHDQIKEQDQDQNDRHVSDISNDSSKNDASTPVDNSGGIYNMVAGAAATAGSIMVAHAPQVIREYLPRQSISDGQDSQSTKRQDSVSSIDSTSSVGSFTSALDRLEDTHPDDDSTKSMTSSNQARSRYEKELQKLEERKRKLDEKLARTRQKEQGKNSDNHEKEAEVMRKVEAKHSKEIKRQEARYRKEVEKLEKKKEKESQRVQQKRRKAEDKDEKARRLKELEGLRAELSVSKKEGEIMKGQVADLQAENTALAAKLGRMGENPREDVTEDTDKHRKSRADGTSAGSATSAKK